MGWFEEQIKYREQKDDENFSDALNSVASAVMGKRLTDAINSRVIAQTAIEEILKFYHCKMKKDDLPAGIESVEDQLEYFMRPFGIMRRNVVLDKGWYKNAVGAMLGTLREDGSAVALIPSKGVGYTYLNLKTGKKERITRKNESLIDAEAMCFYKQLPLRALTVKDLLIFMVQQYSVSDGVMYVGLMLLTSLLGLLSPLFTKWLFGFVLESGSLTVLLGLAGFMLSYTLCRLLITTYQSLINSRIGIKQNIAVQAAVMSRLMSLPAPFFKRFTSGELNQRAAYVQRLCGLIMDTVGNVGLSSLFSLIYVGQIFSFAPALVAPALLTTLATVLISVITTFAQMRVARELMTQTSKTSGMTYSTISGIQKIKLAGAEKRMFTRWARQYAREAELMYNPPLFLRLSDTFSLAVSLIGTIALYFLAVRSGVSVSDYYAFTAAYGMVSGAFMALAGMAKGFADIKATLDMARPIMEAEPELDERKEVVTRLHGAIELNDISFRYNDDMPLVLDNLSLKIKRGEFLAIVGPTGCGKSTLLRLLLGFEKPQKGAIYYDRRDMNHLDLKSLRRHIGTVMQDGKLFSGDIYSNIVIAAPELTVDQAWEAAKIASVDEDIKAMPMGMYTLISEGQGGISGGQKQRLMIARAVAPRPGILMFDEATSALDNVTQKRVSDAIDGLKCTRIVIAHRLSTIRHADRILYLEGGKVREEGNYEELIAKNGKFAELVARQRLDTEQA